MIRLYTRRINIHVNFITLSKKSPDDGFLTELTININNISEIVRNEDRCHIYFYDNLDASEQRISVENYERLLQALGPLKL